VIVRGASFGLVAIVFAGVLVWWSRPVEPDTPTMRRGPNTGPVQLHARGDDAMEAAIQLARSTVGELIAELEATEGRGIDAQVKVPIVEGDTVEHVWLVRVRYEDGMIHGRVANVPMYLRDWERGDPTMVLPSDISDWLLIREGVLRGGYVLCLTRERMDAAERDALDQAFRASFGARLELTWPDGCPQ
jgi:uncharacterized protein YegJ (DUF2314 family)